MQKTVRRKSRSRSFTLFVLFTVMLLSFAFTGALVKSFLYPDREDDDGISVAVTVIPQVEMVKAIGGEFVHVTSMIPEDRNPQAYQLASSSLVDISDADIYFTLGSSLNFEIKYMDVIAEQNPEMKIVNCSHGLLLKNTDEHWGIYGVGIEPIEEAHAPGIVAPDPYTWLSPLNSRLMALNVYYGLASLDPENEPQYRNNLEGYNETMNSLTTNLSSIINLHRPSTILTYHAAWGYFLDDFFIEQHSFERNGLDPAAIDVVDTITLSRELNITVVFVSPQFSATSAREIANEIGGSVVYANPMPHDLAGELMHIATSMTEGMT